MSCSGATAIRSRVSSRLRSYSSCTVSLLKSSAKMSFSSSLSSWVKPSTIGMKLSTTLSNTAYSAAPGPCSSKSGSRSMRARAAL
ncbi:hypothetical protein D3C71_1692370 [compost metagenome]